MSATSLQAGDTRDIGEISLEDLLKEETTVASEKPLTPRETPGIITIISRDEIIRSGARDLMDLLQQVPGFYFGLDVHSVTGLGFRGNWGHEGKILLIVDGQEMNESFYSTLQFGTLFPVDLIEKIEIIRGPGSAIYGGAAELAVINITTRTGANFEGVSGGATAGVTADTFMRHNYHIVTGGRPSEDLYIGGSLFAGHMARSDRNYTDFYGTTVNMEDAGRIYPMTLNLKGDYRGLRVRFMLDHSQGEMRDGYDVILPERTYINFLSYYTDVSYAWKPVENLTITPLFSFRRQQPWASPDANPAIPVFNPVYFEKTADKYTGSLKAAWQATDELHLTAGTQLEFLHATDQSRYPAIKPRIFANGKDSITYRNLAVYAQGLFRHEIVNVTAGARFENHEQYGSSFVPRIALTKVFGRFHAKGLWSRAFRAPSIENIELNQAVDAEKTNVFEAELGVQFADNGLFSVNFFDITMKKPIVYNFDAVTSTESYANFSKTGSRGVEAELKWREKWGFAGASYSFYHTADKNRVPLYQVPGRTDVLLGFPSHKVTLSGAVAPVKNLSIGPSLVFMSPRYGYGRVDFLGNQLIRKYPELWLLNLHVRYENLIVPGLAAGAGIMNLFNENDVLIQPYDGYHPPLPGRSREFVFSLSYALDGWKTDSRAEPEAAVPGVPK